MDRSNEKEVGNKVAVASSICRERWDFYRMDRLKKDQSKEVLVLVCRRLSFPCFPEKKMMKKEPGLPQKKVRVVFLPLGSFLGGKLVNKEKRLDIDR